MYTVQYILLRILGFEALYCVCGCVCVCVCLRHPFPLNYLQDKNRIAEQLDSVRLDHMQTFCKLFACLMLAFLASFLHLSVLLSGSHSFVSIFPSFPCLSVLHLSLQFIHLSLDHSSRHPFIHLSIMFNLIKIYHLYSCHLFKVQSFILVSLLDKSLTYSFVTHSTISYSCFNGVSLSNLTLSLIHSFIQRSH